jgi:hypothetical protein
VDILNSREWALVIWFFIFIIFALFFGKINVIQWSFKKLLKAFFVKAIFFTFALMIIYIGAVVFVLFKIGLWELYQLKNTIIWSISVGAVSLFKIATSEKKHHLFKDLTLDNLRLVAIIQFVVGVYTFGLVVEILIVPFLFILAAMSARLKIDKKNHSLLNILNSIIAAYGTILIAYTIYMLVTNFGEFAKKQTIYDFFIPPLLTVMYLPFIFTMMVLITYESVFFRLQYFINDLNIRRFAKIYSIFRFHLRINLLERWTSFLSTQAVLSRDDIKKSIDHVYKLVSVERNPPIVKLQEGWSPYLAKQFLKEEGLETGYYHPIGQEEWYASSKLINLGDDVIPNNISYYVDGNENIAKSVEIIVNIYSKKSASMAHSKLLSAAKTILKVALGIDISKDIETAIMNGKNQVLKLGYYTATIEKNDWAQSPVGGYDIKFILSHI